VIFHQNVDFWSKFRFLTKISIFCQNFDFWSKFRFFTKMSIFCQNFDFYQTFIIGQNFYCCRKCRFLAIIFFAKFFYRNYFYRNLTFKKIISPQLNCASNYFKPCHVMIIIAFTFIMTINQNRVSSSKAILIHFCFGLVKTPLTITTRTVTVAVTVNSG